MKVGVLYSGGKDSTLALLRAKNFHEISCLITLYPKKEESYMFHFPNIRLVELQAKAMEVPLVSRKIRGEKEKEVKNLERVIKEAVKKHGIEGVVTGAIKSVYQATRIQKICKKLNLWCFNPLWLSDETQLIKDVLKNKFEVIITMVASYPFTEEFLGRKIDEELISILLDFKEKFGISLIGEGGEFETLVLDAPFFKKKIKIERYKTSYENFRGTLIIKSAKLVEK
jgi:ABC transporter with metal-binding/Fe-S-binding domain ATP-binding protein